MKLNISTQKVALMATLAALYAAIAIFVAPIQIPIPGVPGLEVSPAALVATILGLILGPYLGITSALIGASAAWALTGGSPFGLPFLLSPPLNAFVSGSIFYRKWKMAFAAMAILILAFPFTPPVLSMANAFGGAQVAIWVLWDKIIALLLILPLAFFSKRIGAVAQGAALFFILGFIGNQADNLWGSFIYAWPVVYNGIFQMPTEAVQLSFLTGPFLFPAIRLIQAFFVMLIAIPLVKVLSSSNWLWSKNHILAKNNQTPLTVTEPAPPPPPPTQ